MELRIARTGILPNMRFLTTAALFFAVAVTLLASTAGVYRGGLKLELPAGAKAPDQMSKFNVTLTLKSDGTYTGVNKFPKQTSKTSGKWTQSGDTVTLTQLVRDGNKLAKPEARVMKLSKDGMTLTHDMDLSLTTAKGGKPIQVKGHLVLVKQK